MSGILKVLQVLSPPPAAPMTEEYDGLEFRFKMLVFRPAMFKNEAIILGCLGLYMLWFFVGGYINNSRAKKTMAPYVPLLESNFTSVQAMQSSGSAQHLIFATGRRNVLSLHGTLLLYPIHDIVGLGIRFGRTLINPTYDPSEGLIWGFTLGRGEAGMQDNGMGVWAILDKNNMRQIRETRWDLSFPRLHEHVSVPNTHQLFSEHSEITEALLKTPNVGLSELLANHVSSKILKYFIITDQPPRRPAKGALPVKFRSREIHLAVHMPSTAEQSAAVKAWLQVALNIADLMAKSTSRPDVTRKLANTRKTVDSDLSTDFAKEQAEDNPPDLTPEEKRLAKKKAERAQMSEKEIKRLDELEKKREMRKIQKKGGFKQQ